MDFDPARRNSTFDDIDERGLLHRDLPRETGPSGHMRQRREGRAWRSALCWHATLWRAARAVEQMIRIGNPTSIPRTNGAGTTRTSKRNRELARTQQRMYSLAGHFRTRKGFRFRPVYLPMLAEETARERLPCTRAEFEFHGIPPTRPLTSRYGLVRLSHGLAQRSEGAAPSRGVMVDRAALE